MALPTIGNGNWGYDINNELRGIRREVRDSLNNLNSMVANLSSCAGPGFTKGLQASNIELSFDDVYKNLNEYVPDGSDIFDISNFKIKFNDNATVLFLNSGSNASTNVDLKGKELQIGTVIKPKKDDTCFEQATLSGKIDLSDGINYTMVYVTRDGQLSIMLESPDIMTNSDYVHLMVIVTETTTTNSISTSKVISVYPLTQFNYLRLGEFRESLQNTKIYIPATQNINPATQNINPATQNINQTVSNNKIIVNVSSSTFLGDNGDDATKVNNDCIINSNPTIYMLGPGLNLSAGNSVLNLTSGLNDYEYNIRQGKVQNSIYCYDKTSSEWSKLTSMPELTNKKLGLYITLEGYIIAELIKDDDYFSLATDAKIPYARPMLYAQIKLKNENYDAEIYYNHGFFPVGQQSSEYFKIASQVNWDNITNGTGYTDNNLNHVWKLKSYFAGDIKNLYIGGNYNSTTGNWASIDENQSDYIIPTILATKYSYTPDSNITIGEKVVFNSAVEASKSVSIDGSISVSKESTSYINTINNNGITTSENLKIGKGATIDKTLIVGDITSLCKNLNDATLTTYCMQVSSFGIATNVDLYVHNNINIDGSINFTSDRRCKENLITVSAENCLKAVEDIDVKTYNYVGKDKTTIGIVAQDIETYLPEYADELVSIVSADGLEDKRMLEEHKLVFILWAALKEEIKQRKRLEDLILSAKHAIL